MNIRRSLLAASIALLAVACGGGEEGDSGALAAVFPNVGYTGTDATVLISGNVTTWTQSSAVNFGPGVTVNSVELVGPSSIKASITVAQDADAGPRTVSVDSDTLTAGFTVTPSLAMSAEGPRGTIAQGSVVTFVIENMNPAAPFDATKEGDGLLTPVSFPNFTATVSGSAVNASIADVTPTQAIVTVFIDVGADIGPRDLTLHSGPTGEDKELVLPSVLDVKARTAEDYAGKTFSGKQEAPAASRLIEIPASDGDVSLLNLSISTFNENAGLQMILLGDSGSFDQFLDVGSELNFTNIDGRYLIIFDRSAESNFNYTVTAGDINLGALISEPSPESNETSEDAVEAALPSIRSGALTSETDSDFYSLSLAEDTTVTLFTEGGDQYADPILQVFAADDLETPVAAVDNDFHETIADLPLAAGDYFVVVTQSDYFPYDSSQTDYNLIIIGDATVEPEPEPAAN